MKKALFSTTGNTLKLGAEILVLTLCLLFPFSCREEVSEPTGHYALELTGLRNATTGQLEIVGEPGDYFGKLVLEGTRTRTFSVGLISDHRDTLNFTMPGGGYLNLIRRDTTWIGNFKYFGLESEVTARKTSESVEDLQALIALKPLGKGLISTNLEESFPAFDSENSILFFTRDNQIMSSIYDSDTGWQEAVRLPFSGLDQDSAPSISADGTTLLFSSNRKDAENSPGKKNLWITRKTDDTWSVPTPLPHPINLDSIGDYHGGISRSGDYYFVSYDREGGYGRSDIYIASLSADGFYSVENLGPQINTELSEADVYIDPDETFLLFASTDRLDSFGADDIYISFKEPEGWSKPVNLGPKVNSFAYEYGAWVDMDNGFLYFNSFRRGSSDIYRIPLKQIGAFEPILN